MANIESSIQVESSIFDKTRTQEVVLYKLRFSPNSEVKRVKEIFKKALNPQAVSKS